MHRYGFWLLITDYVDTVCSEISCKMNFVILNMYKCCICVSIAYVEYRIRDDIRDLKLAWPCHLLSYELYVIIYVLYFVLNSHIFSILLYYINSWELQRCIVYTLIISHQYDSSIHQTFRSIANGFCCICVSSIEFSKFSCTLDTKHSTWTHTVYTSHPTVVNSHKGKCDVFYESKP